jgi:hypothetical protein
MYKLRTKFSCYRYNSIPNNGEATVTWYVLETKEHLTETGRCFSKDELNLFLEFVNTRPQNFPNEINFLTCDAEDITPFSSVYSTISSGKISRPDNIILRKSPALSPAGNIYHCMDIVLTHNNKDNHTYELDFDVIGIIE